MAQKPVQTPRQARIVAAAMLCSPLIFALVGTGLALGGGLGIELEFPAAGLVALGVVGAGALALSFVFRRQALVRMPEDAPLQQRMGIVIVGMALSETPAIMGLIVALLTGDLVTAGIFWGLGFAGMVHHFPGRGWLEAAGAPRE